LAQETSILLLDEPTTFLDLAHQLEVLNLLASLNEREQRTIVLVLHDINQAARYSHHVIAMRRGRILIQGTPVQVITEQTIPDIFGISCVVIDGPVTGTPLCIPKAELPRTL
jgi:iron complex transport system ATP-binding protein